MDAPQPPLRPVPMAAAPDGRWVVYRDDDGKLVFAAMDTRPSLPADRVRLSIPEGVASLSASFNGQWLAVGHATGRSVAVWGALDETLRDWREITRAVVEGPDGPDRPVEVAFAPAHDTLAVACGDHLQLLRLDEAELLRRRDRVRERVLMQGFLTAEQLVEALRASARIRPSELPVEPLRIFASPTQQTWLIMTQRSLCVMLDDANTRRDGNLVQQVMRSADALPPVAFVSPQGMTDVGFGQVSGRWHYSASLYPSPRQLEEAISARVGLARGEAPRVIHTAQAVSWVAASGRGNGPPDLERDARALEDWFSVGGGVSADDRVVIRGGGWENIRQALARQFQRADLAPIHAALVRRLYVYVACRFQRRAGELHLLFDETGPDSVTATPLSAFEAYLQEQFGRHRYSEIVLLIDAAMVAGAEPKAPGFGTPPVGPISPDPGSSYLRAMSQHIGPAASGQAGESLAGRVLRRLTTAGPAAPTDVLTSTGLASFLSGPASNLQRVEIRQSGPEFKLLPDQATGSAQAASASASERLTDFVFGVDLPEPPAPAAETPTRRAEADQLQGATQVIGAHLAQFTERVSAEDRRAVSNCLLLAQLAANQSGANRESDLMLWYEQYLDVLRQLGWTAEDLHFATVNDTGPADTLQGRALDILTELLGPEAVSEWSSLDALRGLREMGNEKPWVTLFNRQAGHAHGAKFQVGRVDVEPEGQVRCRLVVVAVEAHREISQILFFRSDRGRADIRTADCRLGIPLGRLRELADAVARRVAPFAADYMATLEP